MQQLVFLDKKLVTADEKVKAKTTFSNLNGPELAHRNACWEFYFGAPDDGSADTRTVSEVLKTSVDVNVMATGTTVLDTEFTDHLPALEPLVGVFPPTVPPPVPGPGKDTVPISEEP